jgi:signal transduction histidine kinase
LWKRWWFLTAAGLLISMLVYQGYRYQVEQLLALERVRTRIATDLHDDIGSSLTQIAIMSELTRRNQDDARAAERLSRISDLSRELVDSMSDIVWAINPKRDHLSDLVQRMRHFATEVLEAANIEVSFMTSQDGSDVPLQADVRREVFLVFKESLNNIVRHAHCKRVDIQVHLEQSKMVTRICDDGQGFRADACNGRGHGLASMRARAERIGGSVDIHSRPGGGTTVTIAASVSRPAHTVTGGE